MNRVFHVAAREFVVIVTSKAFIIGLLFLPVTIALVATLMNYFGDREFVTQGQVAVVDPTGRVFARLEASLTEGTEAAEALADARLQAIETFVSDDFRAALAEAPQFTLVRLPGGTDAESKRLWLLDAGEAERRLALVTVDADAVARPSADAEYGAYELYVPQGIDNREEIAVHSAVREAIRALRIESLGIDRATFDSATNVARVQSVTVTESGEQTTVSGLNVMLPAAFTFLLFMGVMGGGQGLLNSTIEEKSSRVVEVLLAAVSPMQFMAGKLIGHMCVSLLGMSIYLVAGLVLMTSFSMLGLLDPILILYLFIFFLVTFFIIGSLMMAVGASVTELSEANTLMMPFMLILMLPWFLWFPISRDPDSALSVAFSFIPPVNAFGMLMRLASSEPPPAWQVWLSIGVGIAGVFVALWAAAKVFRIGLLLYGKPPDFRTLLAWIRQA